MNGSGSPKALSAGRRVAAILVGLILPAGAGLLVLGRPVRASLWGALLLLSFALALFTPMPGIIGVLLFGAGSMIDPFIASVPPNGAPSTARVIVSVVLFTLVFGTLRLAERTSIVEPFSVPSESMAPTLLIGDQFLTDRSVKNFVPGEIVVFESPPDPDIDFVKRIAAVGGDTISLHDNVLTVNDGIEQDSPSAANWENDCPAGMERVGEHRCLVPEGAYFMLGDNPAHSADSRFWGIVERDAIKGRAMVVHFSLGPTGPRWSRIGHRLDGPRR